MARTMDMRNGRPVEAREQTADADDEDGEGEDEDTGEG